MNTAAAFSPAGTSPGAKASHERHPTGAVLQLSHRAAAAALVESVTRQLQDAAPSAAATAGGGTDDTADGKQPDALLPILPKSRGTWAAASGPAAPMPPAKVAPPAVSLAAVSAFLQDEMQQLVRPMRRDRSSCDDYDRHVLLLDEYLTSGNGAHGFTPSVVLSGLAEMLTLYQYAFQQGRCFFRKEVAAAADACGTGQPKSHAATAAIPSSSSASQPAWAGLSIDSFLPPLIRRAAPDITRRDEQREADGDAAALECLYSASMSCSHAASRSVGLPHIATLHHTGSGSIRGAGTTAAMMAAAAAAAAVECEEEEDVSLLSGQAVGAAVVKGKKNTDGARHPQRQQTIFTVPEALHALLVHIATHPLICLTPDDQRCLPEAVAALCDVLASIADTIGRDEQMADASGLPAGLPARPSEERTLTHAIRLVALEAMHHLLAPLHMAKHAGVDRNGISAGGVKGSSTALINGRVARPAGQPRQTEKRPKTDKREAQTLYVAAAAALAHSLAAVEEEEVEEKEVDENDSSSGIASAGSQTFVCLFSRWRRLLKDASLSDRSDNADEGEAEGSSMAPANALDHPPREDADVSAGPAAVAPARLRQAAKELSALLRAVVQLLDLLMDSEVIDPMAIPVVSGNVPALVLRTLAQFSSLALLGTASDLNASLCVDLLGKLIVANPAATAHAILYAEGDAAPDGSAAAATTSAEDLFQAFLNQLNAVHRQRHRELRNDLVTCLSTILRADACRCAAGSPSSRPMKAVAVNAVNAMVLVLFDLVCGPEVGSIGVVEGGVEVDGSSAAAGQRHGPRHDISPDDWLSLTTSLSSRMPPLTQQALQRHCATAVRCRPAVSPSLRKDALQFKRLGWQCLQLFYDWQVAHLAATLFTLSGRGGGESPRQVVVTRGNTEADYASFVLVDLCRMGLVDVLTMYCDLGCENTAVVAWTREELLTLQLDAWTLMTAMMGTASLLAEVNAAYLSLDAGGDNAGKAAAAPPRVLLSLADAQFVEAAGIDVVLAYLQAPSNAITLNMDVTAHSTATKADKAAAATLSHRHAEGGPRDDRVVLTGPQEELEVHKKAALMLLSALASNGVSTHTATSAPSRAVRQALLRTPSLVVFLLSVLDSVRAVAGHGGSSLLSESTKNAISSAPGMFTDTVEREFHLSESQMEVVMAVLNLLVGVGEAAEELTGGIREIPDPSPSVSRATQQRQQQPSLAQDLLGESHPRWNRSSSRHGIFALQAEFISAGGVQALLSWLTFVLAPQTQAAEQLGRNFTLTARSAMSPLSGSSATSGKAGSRHVRAPPLMEGLLVRHEPLIASLLDALSVVVIGAATTEAELVGAGGVLVLMDVVEAVAILSDPQNIFAPFMTSSIFVGGSGEDAPSTNVALDSTVVIRDPTCTLQDAAAKEQAERVGVERKKSEQRIAFQELLSFSLNMLSDLLLTNADACRQFTQWRSRRIEKITSANNCSSGVEGSNANAFMNGVQLLINLWLSALPREYKGGAVVADSMDEHQLSESVAVAGLELLRLSLRGSIGESLRKEYVRRLMRQKHIESGARNDFKHGGATSHLFPFTEEELVRYAVYIAQGGALNSTLARNDRESVVASILRGDGDSPARGDVRQQAVDAMRQLLSVTDAESEVGRGAFMKELLTRTIGIGVKVHGCLSALGFEAMVLASDSTRQRKANVLVLEDESEKQSRSATSSDVAGTVPSDGYRVIPLSSAERAQLTVIAALPALCVDEICLSMASVALEAGARSYTGDAFDRASPTKREDSSEGGDGAEKALIRPTTPDRRCLVGMLDDIYARGSELAQLTSVCQGAERALATQLLDRFLATRIRFGPPTPAEAKKQQQLQQRTQMLRRRRRSEEGSTATRPPPVVSIRGVVHSVNDALPAVLVDLSPTASASTPAQEHSRASLVEPILNVSTSLFSSQATSTSTAAMQIPPPRLAVKLRQRLEEKQDHEADKALQLTSTTAERLHATRHRGREASGEEKGDKDAVSMSTTSASGDAGAFVGTALSSTLADAAHMLATGAAQSSWRSASSKAPAGSKDSAKPKPFSSSFGADGKPTLSLAQRRQKKLAMIRNSLRKLPGTCAGVDADDRPLPSTNASTKAGSTASLAAKPRLNNFTAGSEGEAEDDDRDDASALQSGTKAPTLADMRSMNASSSTISVVEIDLGYI